MNPARLGYLGPMPGQELPDEDAVGPHDELRSETLEELEGRQQQEQAP